MWQLILLFAVPLAALAAALSQSLHAFIFRNDVLHFDHVAYAFENARAYALLPEHGRMAVASQWISRDFRGVFLQLAMLFGFPETLALPYGHQFITVPILCLAAAALGVLVYRRTFSLLLAVLAMGAFSLLPFLFKYDSGLGAFLPDLAASLLVAAAGMFLLQSDRGRNLRLICIFAVLAGVAILTRYVSAIYMAPMFAPLLLAYAVSMYLENHRIWPSLRMLLVATGIVALLSGYLLVTQFLPAIRMYRSLGAVSYPIRSSSADFWTKMTDYFGGPTPLLLMLATTVAVLALVGRRCKPVELVECGWPFFAHATTMILVLRTAEHVTAAHYGFPFLFLVAFAPVSYSGNSGTLRIARVVVGLSLATLIAWSVQGYAGSLARAKHPDNAATEIKLLAIDLGERVRREGEHVVWATFFAHLSLQASMEEFYRGGTLPLPAGEDYYFHTRDEPLRQLYAGKSPEQAALEVFDRINRHVDLVVVFDDIRTIDAAMLRLGMMGEYTVAIARGIAASVAHDPSWERAFVLEDTPYGRLAGYRNLRPRPTSSYERRLRGEQLL